MQEILQPNNDHQRVREEAIPVPQVQEHQGNTQNQHVSGGDLQEELMKGAAAGACRPMHPGVIDSR
jgi:hypothetical protein